MKKEVKNNNIKIRLTQRERENIEANLDDRTISAFIRDAINFYLERSNEEICQVSQTKKKSG